MPAMIFTKTFVSNIWWLFSFSPVPLPLPRRLLPLSEMNGCALYRQNTHLSVKRLGRYERCSDGVSHGHRWMSTRHEEAALPLALSWLSGELACYAGSCGPAACNHSGTVPAIFPPAKLAAARKPPANIPRASSHITEAGFNAGRSPRSAGNCLCYKVPWRFRCCYRAAWRLKRPAPEIPTGIMRRNR